MLSNTALTLLAALSVSFVSAEPIAHFEEIKVRQVSAQTTDYNAILSDCIPPTSILSIPTAGVAPTVPADIQSFLMTLTDYCAAATAVPKSLSAEYASYYSAASSWAKINGPAFSSQEAAISKFYASASANPVCAPVLPSAVTAKTTGLGVCTAVTTAKGGSSTASASSGSGSGSGSGSSSGGSSSSSAAKSGNGVAAVLIGGAFASFLAALAVL
jgi:hypothetical protein